MLDCIEASCINAELRINTLTAHIRSWSNSERFQQHWHLKERRMRKISEFKKKLRFMQWGIHLLLCKLFIVNYVELFIFSSPVLKAHLSSSDHLLSLLILSVHMSICVKTVNIFEFFKMMD